MSRREEGWAVLLSRFIHYRASVVLTKLWKSGLTIGLVAFANLAWAQQRPIGHAWHRADLPTGWVARDQVANQPALRGYVQPVELILPRGARVSVWDGATFGTPVESQLLVGLEVGGVYAFKVSNIRLSEGFEIFPTVEVVNRLYPPEGKKLRFPVPIQITQEELEAALGGRFVTRVVYLESAESTLPGPREPGVQDYFEVAPGNDPLQAADQLGRPIAILRMGSRVPTTEFLQRLAVSCLPPEIYPPVPPSTDDPSIEKAIDRETRHYPRIPRNRTIPPGQRPPVWPTPLPVGPASVPAGFGLPPSSPPPSSPPPAARAPINGSAAVTPPTAVPPASTSVPAFVPTLVPAAAGRQSASIEPGRRSDQSASRIAATGLVAGPFTSAPPRATDPLVVAERSAGASPATGVPDGVRSALRTSDARSRTFNPVLVR
jgi:hypothetical protein